jgi:hypothetical protein
MYTVIWPHEQKHVDPIVESQEAPTDAVLQPKSERSAEQHDVNLMPDTC